MDPRFWIRGGWRKWPQWPKNEFWRVYPIKTMLTLPTPQSLPSLMQLTCKYIHSVTKACAPMAEKSLNLKFELRGKDDQECWSEVRLISGDPDMDFCCNQFGCLVVRELRHLFRLKFLQGVMTRLDPCEFWLVGTIEQYLSSMGANPAVVPETLYRTDPITKQLSNWKWLCHSWLVNCTLSIRNGYGREIWLIVNAPHRDQTSHYI